MSPSARRERALGALYGLAIGDALGMPTEMLSGEEVRRRYGEVTGFQPGEGGRGGLPAGHVTDDTEHAGIVARLLIEGDGRVDPRRLLTENGAWQRRQQRAGGDFLLGPSTRRALAAAAAGMPPSEIGRHGTTNGAAMRVTPVGIACPPEPLERLVAAVTAANAPTHATGVAHAGAAAVAAAVSSGIAGDDWPTSYERAISAAGQAADRGFEPHGEAVLTRLLDPPKTVAGIAEQGLGVATEESVPAAFALAALAMGDPWRAGLLAANLGGDSDTIGAMATAMVGAHAGITAFPGAALDTVRKVNALDLDALADGLLQLRTAAT